MGLNQKKREVEQSETNIRRLFWQKKKGSSRNFKELDSALLSRGSFR